MSYDYNALVTSLATHRSNATAAKQSGNSAKYMEHIQEGLQVYDTLSGHCPMTPLLWMQYAFDVSELMASLGGSNSNGNATSKAARQTRLETLELGINEFPGSAVLHLHYCELLLENLLLCSNSEEGETEEEEETEERKTAAQKALLKALQQVGHGSHRNEGDIIAQLYRLHAVFAAQVQSSQDVALAGWLQRARTPMDDANDSLMEEVREFCSGKQSTVSVPTNTLQQEFLPALEEARRWEAKTFSQLRSCEDEITMAMHQEGIAWKGLVDFSPPPSTGATTTNPSFPFVTTTPEFKETVLVGKSTGLAGSQSYYWNGCGGAATAQAFLQYSAACRKFRFPNDNDGTDSNSIDKDDNRNSDSEENIKHKHQKLILSVFERGIADCPTVEGLWLAYLKHLTWLWNNSPDQAPSPQTLKDVATRAVRNCPFSLSLVQQQIHVSLLLANQNGDSEFVMDPEELLQVITKALDSKFLPNPSQTFDLFATAIRVIQRRILFLLAKSALGYDPHSKAKKKLPAVLNFDDAELMPSRMPKQKKSSDAPMPVADPLDDETWTEVQDLCEEMRDMFDEAMKRLNKDHASWTEGRALLHLEWAQMERLVVAPLSCIANPSNVGTNHLGENGGDGHDPLSHLEKAIRLHNPPHPDSYRSLIQYVLNHGASIHMIPAASRSPGDVVSRLRQVRSLYQKAIHSVGRARVKDTTSGLLIVTSTSVLRDFETALASLCHEYQEFERLFGSEQSLADATRLMQKKIQKTTHRRNNQHPTANAQQQHSGERETSMDIDKPPDSGTSSTAKRKASDAEAVTDQDPPAKKTKKEAGEGEKGTKDEPKMQPGQHHRVQVGSVFHRAHPYTVRISNLAVKTGEMDLVETFRQKHKCGHMVHVKVAREKPFHAKEKEAKHGVSKGWALLQFEERASVEKMIDLNDKVELQGKTLQIERSHVPAVGLVPPGMHRVGSKQKKGQEQPKGDDDKKDAKYERDATKAEIEVSSRPVVENKKSRGILAFRPRGVGSKKQRPKAKLDLK